MKQFCAIALVFILVGCSHSTYESYTAENVGLDSTYNSNDLESIIAPFRSEVDAQMSAVIGVCDSTLVKYAPESPLGNFAADVVFEKGLSVSPHNVEGMKKSNSVALLNFGGLRSPINQGDISIGNVFELMPFDNTITIVKLNQTGFQEMLTYLYTMNGQPTSNAQFNLTENLQEVTVNGQDVSDTKVFYIITSNYLASGGDKMDFLKNALHKWDSGVLIRDVFIAHIKSKGTINNNGIDGRMLISK